jgi:hypothetical protein
LTLKGRWGFNWYKVIWSLIEPFGPIKSTRALPLLAENTSMSSIDKIYHKWENYWSSYIMIVIRDFIHK